MTTKLYCCLLLCTIIVQLEEEREVTAKLSKNLELERRKHESFEQKTKVRNALNHLNSLPKCSASVHCISVRYDTEFAGIIEYLCPFKIQCF